jgi:biopolymer transport protein ExbD
MAGGGGGGGDGDYGLQIAPMLDVMFVLMLFFMVMAGSQTKEGELGVDVPGGAAAQGTPPTPIILKVDARGQVYFNDLVVDQPSPEGELATMAQDLPQLRARLMKAMNQFGSKNPVIIAPADTTRHQRVMDILNACSASKVKNLTFGS